MSVTEVTDGRAQLIDLSRRLQIFDWQERRDHAGLIMIAGYRGTIRPEPPT